MRAVCCIGGAHLDLALGLRRPGIAGTSNPAGAVWGVGGVACNVARTVAALGVPASLISVVGSDAAGDRVVADLAETGVDTASVTRSGDHATALYAAILDPDGDLMIAAAAADIYESLDAQWADWALTQVRGAEIVVIEANLPGVVIERIAAGLDRSIRLVADPVSRPKAGRLRPILGRVDVLFCGRDEADVLAGASGVASELALALHQLGPATVVVSRGRHGVVQARAGSAESFDSIPPDRVVDVTGAGDAVVGGFVVGMLHPGPIPPVVWGLGAASLTVESEHPVATALSREQVAARIARASWPG